MKPVNFNLANTIQTTKVELAKALSVPRTERKPLTQAERESLTELTPMQEVFNNQMMDHIAE